VTPEREAFAALRRIEAAQAALAQTLRSVEPLRLRERPPSGEWSAMEHVRHLVFAEQHHVSPFLERGFRWSRAGVPPPNRTGERRVSPVGSDPGSTIEDVFDAWSKVHGVVHALCLAAPEPLAETLERALEGNLRHVGLHTRAIEGLLRG
jgi:hypothetical protein